MKKYNLGIIGLGKFGKKYIDTIKNNFPQINLVAACRQTLERPDFLPQECSFYTNWREIFDVPGLDGLIVATTPQNQYEVAKFANNHRIPLMIEKPLTLKSQDIKNLSIKCLVNYIHLFAPAFVKLKEEIKDKKIQSIITHGYNNGPKREFSSLFDYGCHDISMILSLTNTDPKNIICTKKITDNGEIFEIVMTFDNGVSSFSVVGNGATERKRTLKVNAGVETIVYDSNLIKDKLIQKKISYSPVLQYKKKPIRIIDTTYPEYNNEIQPLTGAIGAFLGLIDGKIDNRTDLKLTSRVTSILEECYKQVENR